jgi:hypothetical protein
LGNGPGYIGFNAIQSALISSIQINTYSLYGNTVNANYFRGDGNGLSNLNMLEIMQTF